MHLDQEVIFMVGLFGTVSLLVYWLSGVLFSKNEDPRIRRLRAHEGEEQPQPEHRSSRQMLAPVMSRMGEAAALDLMVVCVEAGLTLDASVQRVGNEIAMAHPDISREFGITHMETRVGLARVDALRNLGQRTGSPALQSLAAMLVQTERFGTSIAQALRVHAESLRVKRQFAAEENAAKASVKL